MDSVPDAPPPEESGPPVPNLEEQPAPPVPSQPASQTEKWTPQTRRRQKWPPPPDPDRQVVPYWRIPVGLSSDFGPGASLTDDDDYRRIITYRHSSERPPPKPKRHFLLEDVHKLEEWKLEQEKIAPDRAAAAVMLQRTPPRDVTENESRQRSEEPIIDRHIAAKFFELWEDEGKQKTQNDASTENELATYSDQRPTERENLNTNHHHQYSSEFDQATGFTENFETIRRNENFKRKQFQQPTESFAIDTRIEFQPRIGAVENDPLAEITRDLLNLSGEGDRVISISKMSSDYRAGICRRDEMACSD